jgi:hypothetical protein
LDCVGVIAGIARIRGRSRVFSETLASLPDDDQT